MSDLQGSKAKFIRDLLDKSLELPVPPMAPEEFERTFGMKATPQEIERMSMAEVMVRQLVWKAAKGNDKSIGETLDRLLGKAVQTTETTTRSYSYHDFLIECKNADEAEARGVKRAVGEVVRAEVAAPAAALPRVPASDIVADLI